MVYIPFEASAGSWAISNENCELSWGRRCWYWWHRRLSLSLMTTTTSSVTNANNVVVTGNTGHCHDNPLCHPWRQCLVMFQSHHTGGYSVSTRDRRQGPVSWWPLDNTVVTTEMPLTSPDRDWARYLDYVSWPCKEMSWHGFINSPYMGVEDYSQDH